MILSYSRAKADSFAPPFPDTAIPSSQSWALDRIPQAFLEITKRPEFYHLGQGISQTSELRLAPTSTAEEQRGRRAGHFFPDFRLDVLMDAGIHLTTASF